MNVTFHLNARAIIHQNSVVAQEDEHTRMMMIYILHTMYHDDEYCITKQFNKIPFPFLTYSLTLQLHPNLKQ